MWTALLCASLLAAPGESAVLLVRAREVSDARIGGDAILVTDSVGGRARHILTDASHNSAAVLARLRQLHVDTLAGVILSHRHGDHYGSMAGVIAQVPVGSLRDADATARAKAAAAAAVGRLKRSDAGGDLRL
jgi:beta-lactamase superfamily II metal-dependent hydrolase